MSVAPGRTRDRIDIETIAAIQHAQLAVE